MDTYPQRVTSSESVLGLRNGVAKSAWDGFVDLVKIGQKKGKKHNNINLNTNVHIKIKVQE